MKLSLHYYSRMRFIIDLLPLLTKDGTAMNNLCPPQPGLRRNLSSVVPVLHGGAEGPLILDDLSLKTHFSMNNCARHAITMTNHPVYAGARLFTSGNFIRSCFPWNSEDGCDP